MKARARIFAYLVTEGAATTLRVLVKASSGKSRTHNFPLDILGLARLSSESSAALQSAVQRGAMPSGWTPRKSETKHNRRRK